MDHFKVQKLLTINLEGDLNIDVVKVVPPVSL